MQQRLAFKRLVAVVGNDNRRRQALPVQGDAVEQAKLVRPLLGRIGVNGAGGETKVELHVGARTLAGRLSEKLPARVTSEAVLREGFCRIVIGSNAKDLQRTLAH